MILLMVMLFPPGGVSKARLSFELLMKTLWMSGVEEGSLSAVPWPGRLQCYQMSSVLMILISDFLCVLQIPAIPLVIAKKSQQ